MNSKNEIATNKWQESDFLSPFYQAHIIDLKIIESGIIAKTNGFYWSANEQNKLNRQIELLQELASELNKVVITNGEITN